MPNSLIVILLTPSHHHLNHYLLTDFPSAKAYIQGYGSDSGFQIASTSSYGSGWSDRVHGFPVEESPDQPVGGLGLMGVPHPIAGTVSMRYTSEPAQATYQKGYDIGYRRGVIGAEVG